MVMLSALSCDIINNVLLPDDNMAYTLNDHDFTVVTKVGHLRYDLGRPVEPLRIKTTILVPGGY